MSDLQKLLDSLNEELDWIKSDLDELDEEEDFLRGYMRGKSAGIHKAIRLTEAHIAHKKASRAR